MFDTTQHIDLKIASPDGDKSVTVSYPTDEQLAERSNKMKLVVRQLSRGKSMTEPAASGKNDLELVNKIKVSGDELDEYEATQVLGRLVRCDVTDSRREGNRIVVETKVPGAKTTHTLKIPSAKQLHTHGRNALSVVEGRHGLQEMKLNLRASGELYDALVDQTEGYASNVPLPHKSTVVSEAIAILNQDREDSDVEGF